MQAQDIMTKHVVSIAPTASIRQAVNLMLEKKVSGIPVVEDGDKLCGILTEGDLLRRKEIGGTAGRSEAGDQITSLKRYIQSQGWCVSDVMSRDVASVGRNAPLDRIADIMLSRSIKRVPVVDDGHLVGIVSRRDLLHTIIDAPADVVASGDEAVRLAVATRLRTELGLGSDRIDVTVQGAQVTVTGNIDSELQRKAIRVLVEGVRGINGFVDRTHI